MLIAKENKQSLSLVLSDCLAAVSKANNKQSRLWSIYEDVKLLNASSVDCKLLKITGAHNTLITT